MFFALLGGLHLFGVLGIVLGPVVFAAADSIMQILREPSIVTGGGRDVIATRTTAP